MNCNGYCSQCKQNKSCHFSTRIKNNKTPFRELQDFMREPTKEEKESVDSYLKSISKPTGINFWEVLRENNNVK